MVLVFNRNKKPAMRPGDKGHAEMREYQTRIGLLCDIAEEASSITQVSTLLERILKVVQQTVGASITSAFMKDESRARVHLPITVSKYEDAARRTATVIEAEIASLVAGSAAPVLSNNVAADPRFNQKGKQPALSIVRSIIAVPVFKGKKVIGVLVAANKENARGFNERDFDVLKGFASTEALILLVSLEKTAIENVSCLAMSDSLVDGYRNTVHELASAIDVKDAQVYAHSRRTKEYALLAASSLSLPPAELQTIEFGALLHDIGKIGIDSEILCKPGPLTEEEWKIIYEHPQKGADILKDIPYLKDAMNIVLYHHERYDGTGYPRKLKGEEIPIGARLVAVANAFDTMTTDNPYRPAMSEFEALRELIGGTGTQFCPKAVEAFISALKKHHNGMTTVTSGAAAEEITPTSGSLVEVEKDAGDDENLVIKVKKTKEEKNLKKQADRAAKAARIKAEKEAKEAKIKAEQEILQAKLKAEQEARLAKIAAEKQAREDKIKAEKEIKEAKIKAKQEAEQAKIAFAKQAKEAKIQKIRAGREAKQAKIQAGREAKEARLKAEHEAQEARSKAEREAREAKIRKIKEAQEAREAKIKAEQEAQQAKLKAEQEARQARMAAEKQAKEDKIRSEKAARENKKLNIKTEEEAKNIKKPEPPRKTGPSKIDAEVVKGNVRLTTPISVPNEEIRAFGRELEKIPGVKILMLSHSEEEGHVLLLGLQKPLTLVRYIREIPRVASIDKKGGEISVVLKEGYA